MYDQDPNAYVFQLPPTLQDRSRGSSFCYSLCIKVHSELQSCLQTRSSEEAGAVEVGIAAATECIDQQAFIEHEWTIQVSLVSICHYCCFVYCAKSNT